MKRYYFEMEVTGTAACYVDAKTQEEACELLLSGKWECDEGSQETEWNIPHYGNGGPAECLISVEEIEVQDEN